MQNEKIVVVFVLALALIGYDYFFEHPARAMQIIAMRAETNDRLNEVELARAAKAKIPALEKELAGSRQLIKTLQEQLPKRSQIGLLLDQIIMVAPKINFRFDLISPQAGQEKVETITQGDAKAEIRYEEREMSLRIRGTFPMIGQYLENLENLPRLVEVTGIDIKAGGAETQPTTTLRVKTFIMAGE